MLRTIREYVHCERCDTLTLPYFCRDTGIMLCRQCYETTQRGPNKKRRIVMDIAQTAYEQGIRDALLAVTRDGYQAGHLWPVFDNSVCCRKMSLPAALTAAYGPLPNRMTK